MTTNVINIWVFSLILCWCWKKLAISHVPGFEPGWSRAESPFIDTYIRHSAIATTLLEELFLACKSLSIPYFTFSPVPIIKWNDLLLQQDTFKSAILLNMSISLDIKPEPSVSFSMPSAVWTTRAPPTTTSSRQSSQGLFSPWQAAGGTLHRAASHSSALHTSTWDTW